jgi:hypothetical protein
MKRYIFDGGAFVLVFLALAGVLILISEHFAPIGEPYRVRIRNIMQVSDSVEALALGHSANRAIDFQQMGLKGYHLWMGGTDLFELDYQIKALLPLFPNLRLILIPISYLEFDRDNRLLPRFSEEALMMYAVTCMIKPIKVSDMDISGFILTKLSPFIRADHWKGVMLKFLSKIGIPGSWGSVDFCIDKFGMIFHLNKDGERIDPSVTGVAKPELADHYVTKVRRLVGETHILFEKDPTVRERNYALLISIVKRLRLAGIRLILYTPPYLDAVNRAFYESARDEIQVRTNYLREIVRLSGVEYYNFSHDHRIGLKYEYFFDHLHLNLRGAKVFSQELKEAAGL